MRTTTELARVLNDPARAPALSCLSRVRYPDRELRPCVNSDGSVSVTVALYGYGYKYKGPRPRMPPVVSPAAIQAALNKALPDGLTVQTVRVHDTNVYITLFNKEEAN